MKGINLKTTRTAIPRCYCYTTPTVPAHNGWVKIGYTEQDDVEDRINEQCKTANVPHVTEWSDIAVFNDGKTYFHDSDFHAYLQKQGVERMKPLAGDKNPPEWFRISAGDSLMKFMNFRQNKGVLKTRGVIPYVLRDEQEKAVTRTAAYFESRAGAEFLWNAKPRFGKTLAAYDLCRRIQAKKEGSLCNILIVTNRPAIANSWYDDYAKFLGTQTGLYFVSETPALKGKPYVLDREAYIKNAKGDAKGCIEFVSLQDLKGSVYFGGHFDKLKEIRDTDWDLLVIDEAHEGVDTYKTDTAFNHIGRKRTLHLSGTPFKALANEKFPEEAIFNWTYADEQKKKRDWNPQNEIENPYANLPRLSLFTYQMSDVVRDKVSKGIELAENDVEEYAFDLNEFFRTNEAEKFVHDEEVNKFLDALARQEKFPFSTPELRNELKHTFWLLNRVASARALAKKLKLHPVFKDYEIILAAGDGRLDDDDENEKSFDKVTKAVAECEKTITLSVGQLTTGVTIPEWTAVLMLCNMSSPALYMQAAFRAQNPWRYQENGELHIKENAYVFDFDPARTLTIFEKFANDLIPQTSGEKGDFDSKKQNVRELLNFFPVYGEDDEGEMIELDAEKVLTIPRRIYAREVVERGFMSNFLFANIKGIFGAPKEIIDLINNMQAIEEPKTLLPAQIDGTTAESLNLNARGEVEIPEEQIVGQASALFGEKLYKSIGARLEEAIKEEWKNKESKPNPERDELKRLQEKFSKPIAGTFIENAKERYGSDLKKSTQNQLERKIQETTDAVINREYGDYTIRENQLIIEQESKILEAQESGAPLAEITKIDEAYNDKRERNRQNLMESIKTKLNDKETVSKVAATIVETVETEKSKAQKDSIEGNVRDHLRGFSRTIPAFLMAYGDENTTLGNFDSLVPEEVFWEVTVNPQNGQGVTLDQFRMLRDGGDYTDENGVQKHFEGHLFDEVVFNDAVKEFMKKRAELANYFEPNHKGDIFDYIPPQRTNQIFTPKKVVKDMVDRLERENPGCFDNPDATFADLYMKSGMYITEIVTRLYQSERVKSLFPDDAQRLNHIFARQVYGCAPTEIIYRICLRYILGFSDTIHIEKNNIKLFDALEPAKKGTMETELRELFGL